MRGGVGRRGRCRHAGRHGGNRNSRRSASRPQEHAGSQWDADVVGAVLAVVADADEIGRVFDRVGRNDADNCCETCRDALPAEVRELLSALSLDPTADMASRESPAQAPTC